MSIKLTIATLTHQVNEELHHLIQLHVDESNSNMFRGPVDLFASFT